MKFAIQPSVTIKLLTHPQYPDFSIWLLCANGYLHARLRISDYFLSILFFFFVLREKLIYEVKEKKHTTKVVQLNDFQFLFIYFRYTFFE